MFDSVGLHTMYKHQSLKRQTNKQVMKKAYSCLKNDLVSIQEV